MMAITLTDTQLPELLESLQGIPHAYNIRGEVTSKLNNVITDYDFIVDSWPDYKALVVRVNPTRAKYPGYLGRLVCLYATDKITLETLLETPGLLDWSHNFRFIRLNPLVKTVVERITRKRSKTYTFINLVSLRATEDTLIVRPIPDGFKIARIHPDQAPLVCSKMIYNDGKSAEAYVRHIVETLPSCCLYNKEGSLVGFGLQYHFGVLGSLYVFEEHRGKGYAKVIASHLARSYLEKEKEVYIVIKHNHFVSIKLHESIGYKKVEEAACTEIWLE